MSILGSRSHNYRKCKDKFCESGRAWENDWNEVCRVYRWNPWQWGTINPRKTPRFQLYLKIYQLSHRNLALVEAKLIREVLK